MTDTDRLYSTDSFLTRFDAVIVDARSTDVGAELALDRTAFYATSGGQPHDTGTLSVAGREVRVLGVEEDGNGTVWHRVSEPMEIGARVAGRIDWARRFDHMQQHSGQHLISAVFAAELNAQTVSFHLGETSSTIDLAGGAVTAEAMERIEQLANRIVGEDRPVSVSVVERTVAEAMLAAGELRKLPEREGAMRLVTIADCDQNACGGTHVRATGQIGAVLLRRLEKVSRGVRVEFVCGERAVRAAREDWKALSEAAGALSVGAAELPAAVRRLLAEQKSAARERQRLREELAVLEGARLAAETAGAKILERVWRDRDRDFVRLLASRTTAEATNLVALFTAEEQEPARVYLARSRDVELNCGAQMKEALAAFGLRGGGSPDLAQGEIAAAQAEQLRAVLRLTI